MKFDPLQDGKSSLELLDFMGGELAIVNDARVSFAKSASSLCVKDIRLIHYLLEHEHFSPFRSTVFKFRVHAPLFIARQWFKYSVASSHLDSQNSWNETSARYVKLQPVFYIPSSFRSQSPDNKQASSSDLDLSTNQQASSIYEQTLHTLYQNYTDLLSLGVSREQARGLLPACVYTEWIWTCSLQSLLHFLQQRLKSDSQFEIRLFAQSILSILKEKCPNIADCLFS